MRLFLQLFVVLLAPLVIQTAEADPGGYTPRSPVPTSNLPTPQKLPPDVRTPQSNAPSLPPGFVPKLRKQPPVTYYLSCTLGYSAITHMHTWTIRNYGYNTAPAGLAFRTVIGSLFGSFRLSSALAPDQTEVFGTPTSSFDRGPSSWDVCEVRFDH